MVLGVVILHSPKVNQLLPQESRMRIYKIAGKTVTRFAPSQGAATTLRMQLVSEGLGKRSDFTISQIDIDTKKEGLIQFLNDLSTVQEVDEESDDEEGAE